MFMSLKTVKPRIIEKFRGLSEKDLFFSEASFKRFLKVYLGLPANLLPWSADVELLLNPSHFFAAIKSRAVGEIFESRQNFLINYGIASLSLIKSYSGCSI